MNYNDTLMELYRQYVIEDIDIKYKFFHDIKMKHRRKKLKKIIRKKIKDGRLCFVEYKWILKSLLGDKYSRDLYLNYGINSYNCRIQENGFIQLHIKKYEFNIYKQKNDLTDTSMRLRFFSSAYNGCGELYVELNTGYNIYTGILSDISLFIEDGIDSFIRYLNKWDYKNKRNPIDTSYYIPLHSLMINLIEKVFELEE